MTSNRPCRASKGRTARLGLGLTTLTLAALTFAAMSAARAEGLDLVLKYGDASGNYERTGVGLRFGPLWTDRWGPFRLALHPEVELSRMRHTGRSGPRRLDQGGGLGLLRAHYGDGRVRPYGEVGLGASLFSRDTLGSKEFSTHFQFSQHLGLGVELGGTWSVGWQYAHYSNADIERPNDGVDFHQIAASVRF